LSPSWLTSLTIILDTPMSYLTIPISGMIRLIHLTMFPAPHPLIRRAVQRNAIARTKLTLLSLPNDTFVDLILVHLCVRDILRLRSVCIIHLRVLHLTELDLRYAGYSTSLRTNPWFGSASCAPFTFHFHLSLLPFATPSPLSAA
jgi:hypothetical protein